MVFVISYVGTILYVGRVSRSVTEACFSRLSSVDPLPIRRIDLFRGDAKQSAEDLN